MITNGVPAGNKGKGVEIHHHLFDALWDIGTRQIDASILLASPSDDNDATNETQVKNAEDGDNEEEKKEEEQLEVDTAAVDVDGAEEAKKQGAADADDAAAAQVDENVSVEDMDARILEAFYRSLIESVKDEDLPLEPCDYMKNHFAEYSCDEFRLDLRQSSFKKIGKLLDQAGRDQTIDYDVPRMKDHKVIMKVNRSHPR